MRYDTDWRNPMKADAAKTLCPGCSTVVLAAICTRGHCRACVERLGVENVVAPAPDPQMRLL